MVAKNFVITKEGLELAPGFSIPWMLVDGFICDIIEKGDAEALTSPAVLFLDGQLETLVQKTEFKFDNVGKQKLLRALTVSMVKKYTPELLE